MAIWSQFTKWGKFYIEYINLPPGSRSGFQILIRMRIFDWNRIRKHKFKYNDSWIYGIPEYSARSCCCPGSSYEDQSRPYSVQMILTIKRGKLYYLYKWRHLRCLKVISAVWGPWWGKLNLLVRFLGDKVSPKLNLKLIQSRNHPYLTVL